MVLMVCKVCNLIEEGGVGIRDMGEIRKALHMKIAWLILSLDNLWSRFSNRFFILEGHLEVLEVYENSCVKIREGNLSFWFDKWLHMSQLSKSNVMA